MQYKPETEKVAMMNVPYMMTPRPLLLTENAEIQRTRKILLIILGICLALTIVGTISAISGPTFENQANDTRRGSQIGQNLITVLFYTFGIIVAYRYYPTGLRVFAYLGVIALVLMGIGAILLLLFAIGAMTLFSHADNVEHKDYMIAMGVGAAIFIAIYAAGFILTVIIVKFAFKLARLIGANTHLTAEQA